MSEEIDDDRAKLKQGLVKVLTCVATISSAAAVVNPVFGLVGSLSQLVLHHVDDEDILTLKRDFEKVNYTLDELSQKNRNVLSKIKKETVDEQYSQVEQNLRNQFVKYLEYVETPSKKDEFKEYYRSKKYHDNLQFLYDGVIGKRKVFSKPILDVYLEQQVDRPTMEALCTHLTFLLGIGLTARMGYAAIIGDDEESLKEEWDKRMEEVQEKMKEALQRCK